MGPDIYKNILDNLYDGVYFVNKQKQITLWNKSARKITGYTKEEVLTYKCSDNILRHINDNGDELCIKGCPLGRTLDDGKIREADVYLHHRNGHRVPVSIRVSPLYDDDKNIVGAVEIFSENSRKINMIHELESLKNEIFSDELTLVGNRKFAELNINTRFTELKIHSIPFGILFFDIDDFKSTNDAHGHQVGDQVLKMVAKTVSNILRSLDTICRWGGDEFIVIIPNIDTSELELIAKKIKMFIEKTWLGTPDGTLRTTLSIGGCMATRADTLQTLIKRADQQMYLAKEKGKNTISII